VFAQLIVNLPFAIRMVRTAFADVSPRMEFVAKTLGATPGDVFRTIILPQCRNALISTFVLTWARGMGEFGATLMLVGVTRMKTETLPGSIYLSISTGNNETAMATAMIMLLLSAATLLAVTSVSANSILYSSRGQIKGLTTSAGLVSCCILGFATGAGLYALTLIVYVFLLCILAGFPAFEAYLKNRSNHFEVHMELKSSSYLRDFVTVSRRLGLRIDDIEANQAYAGSGLSVYSVSLTICSQELKKYKTHVEIIEALSSLDYIYHIEEMH